MHTPPGSAFDPGVDLGDGVRMPLVGCGTQFGFREDGHARGKLELGARHVAQALRAGFRLLDTARGYGTEQHLLPGMAAAGVPREETFLVTKGWVGVDHPAGREANRAAIDESARRLGGYVDLFLVHQPVAGWQDLWRELEDAQDRGAVRAIGVSNFGPAHFAELAAFARRKPAVNQIHLHPFVYAEQRATIDLCEQHGIRVMAFPRAPWRLGEGSAVDAVAAACGRTRAQVMLRWAVEHGFAVIPLSTDDRHLADNCAVREFRLTAEQVAQIDRIAECPRIRFHVDLATAEEVAGWAFVPGEPLRVRVLAGGRPVGDARHGLPRPDVQAAFDGAPAAAGFSLRLPAGCLDDGPRQLELVFEAPSGARAQSGPLPVAG